MTTRNHSQPTEVSVHQFVGDPSAVISGLREGKRYVLTIDGESLADVTPIVSPFVITSRAQSMFTTAPLIDYDEMQRDLDDKAGS